MQLCIKVLDNVNILAFLSGDGVDGLGYVLLMGALIFCFVVMDIWYNKCIDASALYQG